MICITNIFVNFIQYFSALIILQPFEKRLLGNWLNIITELCVSMGITTMFVFVEEDLNSDTKDILGWVIISILGLSIVIQIGTLLVV